MIRVYDLETVPQIGEVLTCKCYKKGDSLPSIVIVSRFGKQSDPMDVFAKRVDTCSIDVLRSELDDFFYFIDSPHWRDSVAKQWKRYGDLFDDEMFKANNDS